MAQLPSADAMIERRHAKAPITEAHLGEIFPRGLHSYWVLVVKDKHGQILAIPVVNKSDEPSDKPFLRRFERLGVMFRALYIAGYQAYDNVVCAVFGQVPIQYNYFHIIKNSQRVAKGRFLDDNFIWLTDFLRHEHV